MSQSKVNFTIPKKKTKKKNRDITEKTTQASLIIKMYLCSCKLPLLNETHFQQADSKFSLYTLL